MEIYSNNAKIYCKSNKEYYELESIKIESIDHNSKEIKLWVYNEYKIRKINDKNEYKIEIIKISEDGSKQIEEFLGITLNHIKGYDWIANYIKYSKQEINFIGKRLKLEIDKKIPTVLSISILTDNKLYYELDVEVEPTKFENKNIFGSFYLTFIKNNDENKFELSEDSSHSISDYSECQDYSDINLIGKIKRLDNYSFEVLFKGTLNDGFIFLEDKEINFTMKQFIVNLSGYYIYLDNKLNKSKAIEKAINQFSELYNLNDFEEPTSRKYDKHRLFFKVKRKI